MPAHFWTASVTLGASTASLSESYKRQLDLDTAIATTTFTIDGTTYKREVFASSVAQAVVVRLTADKPGSISVEVGLDRPGPADLGGLDAIARNPQYSLESQRILQATCRDHLGLA